MAAGEMPASCPPRSDQPVDGEHADAAAVGQYRQPAAGYAGQMPECLGRGEQFVEVENAQQPGAPERGVIDRIGPGQRPGVGERRLGAERLPSGFDHQHGFRTRRGPRRRHELACVADGFDVEQNGAGCRDPWRSNREGRRNRRRCCRRSRPPRKIRLPAPTPIRPVPQQWRRTGISSARSPAGGIEAAKLALSLARGTSTPRQLGPTRRIPAARAIVRH